MAVNFDDVQGIVLRGYDFGFARYLLYRWELVAQGRRWMQALLKDPEVRITSCDPQAPAKTRGYAVNLALTYQGIKALGLSPTLLGEFPDDFRQGMVARAPLLGDIEHNAPATWVPALGSTNVHALIVIYGRQSVDCDGAEKKLEALAAQTKGVSLLWRQEAAALQGNKEHFGFRDGISQPWVEGTDGLFPIPPSHGGGKWTTTVGWVALKQGEFLLGYPDETGRLPVAPQPPQLSQNGSFLVLRQLKQHVEEFDRFCQAQAQALGIDGGGDRLKALMVGRWPSGCPVSLSPHKDDPSRADANEFRYEGQNPGDSALVPPLGSHIRRTNPREVTDDPKQSLNSNRHRIIRRSMPYEVLREGQPSERGLMFVAVNASISRQFEFLQRHWVGAGEFLQLDRKDRDPLIAGNYDPRDLPPQGQPERVPVPRKFSMPGEHCPVALNLPEFVTTKGGEYFFVPSFTAIGGLTQGAFTSFLAEYDALLRQISEPALQALAGRDLVNRWFFEAPVQMFDELRTKRPIIEIRGYPAFLKSPPIVIATKYADCLEILSNPDVFSVRKYAEKMVPPRGPFILGMPNNMQTMADYQRELKILQSAVYGGDAKTRIPSLIGTITEDIFTKIRPNRKVDVIQEIAWPVPLLLNARYFGLSFNADDASSTNRMKQWMRDIYTDLFLNLRQDPAWTAAADAAIPEFNAYVDGLIDAQAGGRAPAQETVLSRLIAAHRDPESKLTREGVRRNLLGMTVGVVETTLKAIGRTVDQFLRRPEAMEAALNAIAQWEAVRDNKEEAETANSNLDKVILETMRFNPQNHVLYRWCEQDYTLARGTSRETLVRKDSLVFAATLSAMFDPDKIADPEAFHPGRPEDNYLLFSLEGIRHACLGRHVAPLMIREVMKRLLTLPNLRRAARDEFDPLDVRPMHFYLEFDGIQAGA